MSTRSPSAGPRPSWFGRAGVSIYSRYVNRPLGKVAAAAAVRVGLTANQVTALSAVPSVAAILLVAAHRPTPLTGVLVWLLLALGFVLDSADGQVARRTGGGTPAGEWLDHVLDVARLVGVHLAVLVTWFRYFEVPAVALLVPLAFVLVAASMQAAGTLAELLGRREGGPGPQVKFSALTVRSLLLLPADFGVLALSFAALGWRTGHMVVYSALLVWNTLLLFALLGHWFRALSRPRQSPPPVPDLVEGPNKRTSV